MNDFSTMRTNMVDCQIRTNGVINAAVLNVFEEMPRELFVPQEKQSAAYVDTSISLIQDRVLLDPMTHARMVEALAPQAHEVALDIGGATGYSAAILSRLVMTVLSLETRQNLQDKASKILNQVAAHNVVLEKGKLQQGLPAEAPYDVVFVNGAVAQVPQEWLDQLAEGGRLVTVERDGELSVGKAVLYVRISSDNVQRKVLFDANVPYLAGFEPNEKFSF